MPAATAVTRPEEDPMVAPDVLLLLHDAEPVVGSVSTVAVPMQIVEAPAIAAGAEYTAMDLVAKQPDPIE